MNNITRGMLALVTIATLSGCVATTTPQTDARFGEAMSMLKAQQTINPDASLNTDPVIGVDGKAAKGALDNYRDSFRKPPTESAGFMGIGGVGGSN
jgi:hypothetical protein